MHFPSVSSIGPLGHMAHYQVLNEDDTAAKEDIIFLPSFSADNTPFVDFLYFRTYLPYRGAYGLSIPAGSQPRRDAFVYRRWEH